MVTLDQVKAIIGDQLGVEPDTITAETRLVEDLGAGSFDLVDLITMLEEQYDLKVEAVDFASMKTVGDVYEYVQALIADQPEAAKKLSEASN